MCAPSPSVLARSTRGPRASARHDPVWIRPSRVGSGEWDGESNTDEGDGCDRLYEPDMDRPEPPPPRGKPAARQRQRGRTGGLTVGSRPDPAQLGKAFVLLPLGVGFALVNAAQEEIRFRAVPIGLLEPSVGAEAAIWITAAAFGLGHGYGHPSGPIGVLLTFAGGLILAKAFVETRGLAWAWALHAVLDVVIFLFIVLEG